MIIYLCIYVYIYSSVYFDNSIFIYSFIFKIYLDIRLIYFYMCPNGPNGRHVFDKLVHVSDKPVHVSDKLVHVSEYALWPLVQVDVNLFTKDPNLACPVWTCIFGIMTKGS